MSAIAAKTRAMSTDFAALAVALGDLENHLFRGKDEWQVAASDPDNAQATFVDWRAARRSELEQLADDWSTEYRTFGSSTPVYLNGMLAEYGIKPCFKETDRVGIASVFDLQPEWPSSVPSCVIRAEDGEPFEGIAIDQVQFFSTQLGCGDLKDPLIRIPVAGGWLWLMATGRPANEANLSLRATTILEASHKLDERYGNRLAMPALDMTLTSDVSWLVGMFGGKQKTKVIDRVLHRLTIKIQPNTPSNGTITRNITPDTFIMNEPFMGFFTRNAHSTLPLNVFYVDPSCWSEPKEAIPV
ncbi:MAG: hypothetical protein ACQR33_01905 [Candidatus Saccharibacteria bacterium]